jgi:formate-dependent nitrite reductase membrane component NrfD
MKPRVRFVVFTGLIVAVAIAAGVAHLGAIWIAVSVGAAWAALALVELVVSRREHRATVVPRRMSARSRRWLVAINTLIAAAEIALGAFGPRANLVAGVLFAVLALAFATPLVRDRSRDAISERL